LNANSINNLCESLSNNPKISIKGNTVVKVCPHAIGHMILVQEEGDLDSSINICKNVKDRFRIDCYLGIFMENTLRDNLSEHGIAQKINWDGKNLLILRSSCLKYLDQKISSACLQGITPAVATIFQNNLPGLKNFCKSLPKSEQKMCLYRGIGEISLWNHGANVSADLRAYCNNFTTPDDYHICTEAVGFYFVSSRPEQTKDLITFCKSANFNEKENCLGKLAANIKSFFTNQKMQFFCHQESEDVKGFCKQYLKII
jgi:hypothetical protein